MINSKCKNCIHYTKRIDIPKETIEYKGINIDIPKDSEENDKHEDVKDEYKILKEQMKLWYD